MQPSPSIVILSPHRDDAAFSCGYLLTRLLQAGADVTVLNVYTRSGYAPFAPQHGDLEAVSALRRKEDEAFDHLLRTQVSSATPHQLTWSDVGLADAPDRLNIPTTAVLERPLSSAMYAQERKLLVSLLETISKASLVLLPAAIGGHLDHFLVRDAGLEICSGTQVLLYEDLPYACWLTAEERDAALHKSLGSSPLFRKAVRVTLPGAQTLKRKYALCYGSQIGSDTADVMEQYGSRLGYGELFYGSTAAHDTLRSLIEAS